jgi:hypothetical protein
MSFEAQSGIDIGSAVNKAMCEKNKLSKDTKSKESLSEPYVSKDMVNRSFSINTSNPKYSNCVLNLRVNPYYVDLIDRLSQLDIRCCYTSFIFGEPGLTDIPGYLRMLYLLKCPFFVCEGTQSINKQMESFNSLCYALSKDQLIQLLNFKVDFHKFLLVEEYISKPCISSKAELLQFVDWLCVDSMFSKKSFNSPVLAEVNLPDFPVDRPLSSQMRSMAEEAERKPSPLLKEVSKAVSASTSVNKLLLSEQKKQGELTSKLVAKAKSEDKLKKEKDKQWKQTHDEKGNSGYYSHENGITTFTPNKKFTPPSVKFN